jgi:hypothetical protein
MSENAARVAAARHLLCSGRRGGGLMSMSNKEEQALQAVLERSTVDPDFRRQLLVDPRRAILERFGVSIPSSFNVKFVEKDAGVDALIVLPDFRRPDGELSDGDLESVSGGRGQDHDVNWFR